MQNRAEQLLWHAKREVSSDIEVKDDLGNEGTKITIQRKFYSNEHNELIPSFELHHATISDDSCERLNLTIERSITVCLFDSEAAKIFNSNLKEQGLPLLNDQDIYALKKTFDLQKKDEVSKLLMAIHKTSSFDQDIKIKIRSFYSRGIMADIRGTSPYEELFGMGENFDEWKTARDLFLKEIQIIPSLKSIAFEKISAAFARKKLMFFAAKTDDHDRPNYLGKLPREIKTKIFEFIDLAEEERNYRQIFQK